MLLFLFKIKREMFASFGRGGLLHTWSIHYSLEIFSVEGKSKHMINQELAAFRIILKEYLVIICMFIFYKKKKKFVLCVRLDSYESEGGTETLSFLIS